MGDQVLTGYIYDTPFLSSQGNKIIIDPITQSGDTQGYILYLADAELEELPVYETMCLDQLSLIFSLTISKQREFSASLRQYNHLLLEKLLEKDDPSEEEISYLENSLKISLKTKYYIALANKDVSSAIHNHSIHVEHLFDLIHKSPLLKSILCFEHSDTLVFLIPESTTDSREILAQLYSLAHQHTLTTLIVASDPTNTEFQSAYAQVNRAFSYFSENKGNGYYTLSDLGIMRLFLNERGHINNHYLDALVDQYIQPLLDYDQARKSHLVKTITEYFANNRDMSKTSAALFIHKNTLYQRLAKAEELINCDMSLSEDCFRIQLALKVYEAITILQ